MSNVEDIVLLFTKLGSSEKEAIQASKNKKLTQDLVVVSTRQKIMLPSVISTQLLLRKLLSVITTPARPALPYLANAVIDSRLERDIQVKGIASETNQGIVQYIPNGHF